MALVRCPECGRENVSDGAEMCPNCGYGIKAHYDRIKKQEAEKRLAEEREQQRIRDVERQRQLNEEREKRHQEKLNKFFGSPLKKFIWAFIVISIFVVIGVVAASENAKKCCLSSCKEYKIEGSNYCRIHTCIADGCTSKKSEYNSYCYSHEEELLCIESDCDSKKVSGGEYCSSHTCDELGCYEKVAYDNNYCSAHKKDMRKLLELDRFCIDRVNSAGGIEMYFSATNKSKKEIKYIRFYVDLYNFVGDRIKDEITDKNSIYVEIVGPVKYNRTITYEDIIGYNDNCGKIEIEDITIVYTDGTTYSGWYGYYYERRR